MKRSRKVALLSALIKYKQILMLYPKAFIHKIPITKDISGCVGKKRVKMIMVKKSKLEKKNLAEMTLVCLSKLSSHRHF